MPYKSKRQFRYLHSQKPDVAARFDREGYKMPANETAKKRVKHRKRKKLKRRGSGHPVTDRIYRRERVKGQKAYSFQR